MAWFGTGKCACEDRRVDGGGGWVLLYMGKAGGWGIRVEDFSYLEMGARGASDEEGLPENVFGAVGLDKNFFAW